MRPRWNVTRNLGIRSRNQSWELAFRIKEAIAAGSSITIITTVRKQDLWVRHNAINSDDMDDMQRLAQATSNFWRSLFHLVTRLRYSVRTANNRFDYNINRSLGEYRLRFHLNPATIRLIREELGVMELALFFVLDRWAIILNCWDDLIQWYSPDVNKRYLSLHICQSYCLYSARNSRESSIWHN